jgi:hypothetical protein
MGPPYATRPFVGLIYKELFPDTSPLAATWHKYVAEVIRYHHSEGYQKGHQLYHTPVTGATIHRCFHELLSSPGTVERARELVAQVIASTAIHQAPGGKKKYSFF